MNERHNLSMRPLPGSPPDILDKLVDSIEELFDCGLEGATEYVKGKGSQESAKATEIKAQALALIGNLQLERQRLIDERDSSIAEHERSMYELRTQRFNEVVNILIRLKEFGVEVDLNVVVRRLVQALDD